MTPSNVCSRTSLTCTRSTGSNELLAPNDMIRIGHISSRLFCVRINTS